MESEHPNAFAAFCTDGSQRCTRWDQSVSPCLACKCAGSSEVLPRPFAPSLSAGGCGSAHIPHTTQTRTRLEQPPIDSPVMRTILAAVPLCRARQANAIRHGASSVGKSNPEPLPLNYGDSVQAAAPSSALTLAAPLQSCRTWPDAAVLHVILFPFNYSS